MIKVVLVDDERPALRGLEHLLKNYNELSIIGMYTNPLKAIESIRELKPNVVFLDINMPQLRGIDAASRILDASPETDIIFVTAFEQYALEAFELHAMDYVLKPVSKERLEKTVERLYSKISLPKENYPSTKIQIRCFGRFEMGWEDSEPIKWRIEKARELFAFLLQNHSRNISKDELLDKLWPEVDPERAIKLLYNGIYYIRKALKSYGIGRDIISIDNNYNLKLGRVDWDVERFCKLFGAQEKDSLVTLEEIETLYTGDYLESELYPWSDFERERLSKLYENGMIELSNKYMNEKKYASVEEILLKIYNRNPYLEVVTELLLRLYIKIGNKTSAVKHFNAYSLLLQEELGIKPDERLMKIVSL